MARVSSSSAYLARHMGQVPVLVIPCITVRPAWPAGETQAGLWGIAAARRVELHAGLPGPGLGTAWTTLHLRYETEIAGLLGLPGDIRQGALIPTAYYTGGTFRPAARLLLADVLHVDHLVADLCGPYARGATGNRRKPAPDTPSLAGRPARQTRAGGASARLRPAERR